MKNYIRFIIIVLLSTIAVSAVFSQEETVTLSNGKKVVLHSDHTWSSADGVVYDYDFTTLNDNSIPEILRGGIQVDKDTLVTAMEMYLQGWRYTMPCPKCKKARRGHSDGYTTWWCGYWFNEKTGKYSSTVPEKASNGFYLGDHQNRKGEWSNGKGPANPTKIMWLLSSSGGVKP